MKFICIGIVLSILILMAASRNYQKEILSKFARKEDPLVFFYPASARIYSFLRFSFPFFHSTAIRSDLKLLYVRENVEEQLYLYYLRKISLILTAVLAGSALGILLSLIQPESTVVTALDRAGWQEGTSAYELEVEYDGTEETIELLIEEQQLDEDEAYAMFDDSIQDIKTAILGDNPDLARVSSPLDLITAWNGIKISWDISDIGIMDYGGRISEDVSLSDGETLKLTLCAHLSAGGYERTYVIPAVITAPEVSEKEAILNEIDRSLKEADGTSAQVALPEEINGKKITFKTISGSPVTPVMALTAVFIAVLIFGYDKKLKKQIRKRQDEMMMDFSEIVFKLSLLYEAGLSILGAWERIVSDAEDAGPEKMHFAYSEMKLTLEMIRSGTSESIAYHMFGKRCGLQPYIKLGNILEQNLSKGTKGMRDLLRSEAQSAFEQRKRLARKKGEEAGTKMLAPMMILLVIVLIIVAVPALMSITL